LQKRETEQGATGTQLTAVYPLFGQQVPDVDLPLYNGRGSARVSTLAKDKVTLLVLFWAGGGKSDFTAIAQTNTAMELLGVVDRIHVDWTLKLAEPGTETDPTAQPFIGTSTEIAKASTAGIAAKRAERDAAKEAKAAEAQRIEEEKEKAQYKRFSASLAAGIRYYSWEKFDDGSDLEYLHRVNVLAGLKLKMHIVKILAAELSILPSYVFGNFAEDEEHLNEKLQLFIPLSLNAILQFSMADGFAAPFFAFGAGPCMASFKYREEVQPRPGYPSKTEPLSEETHCPSGFGLQVNPGVGAEFRITDKIFAGFDIRYFFMTIDKFTDDEAIEVGDEGTRIASRTPYRKDFKYDNAAVFAYGGIKF
jgi:hypothetical protein